MVEDQVDVLAQREGMVAKLHADIGSRVRKGDLLAQLDDRQLVSDRAALEAKVKSTQAEAQNWEAEIKVLQSDLERDEQMFKDSLITAKQVEHSRYKVIGAQFQLEREHQNLANARATLQSLQLEMEKTRILAPFNGVVARRYVRQGQKLSVNDRVFWVTATAPINVQFTLPEMFVGRIKPGQQISVVAPSSPGKTHSATISRVSPVVDPSSGTIEVLARLADPGEDLKPGMTVTVRVNK